MADDNDVYFHDLASLLQLLLVGLLFVIALSSFLLSGPLVAIHIFTVSFGVTILCDVYVFSLLLFATIRRPEFLPNRLPALIILFLLFFALVLAFAGVYMNLENITWRREVADGQGRIVQTDQRVSEKEDAFLLSLESMVTFGAGASPAGIEARRVVAFQMLSSAGFLLTIFPILVARLAEFEAVKVKHVTFVEKEDGNDWAIVRKSNLQKEEKTRSDGSSKMTRMQIVAHGGGIKLKPPK